MAKTTKKEVQDRVNFIIAEIAKGTRPVTICQNKTVKGWNVDERQVWRYIGKAYRYFEKESSVNRDKELGKILERYEYLYNQAVAYAAETKDFGTAANILDKRAELIGLKKLQVDVGGDLKIKIDYEDDIKSDDLV